MTIERLNDASPYWVLAEDTNLTPKARATGSIVIEHELLALPCFAALKAGDVVLDVGAFIGDTALPLLGRGIKVYAFEAQPDAFECLCRNTHGHDVRCYNRAVGNGEYVGLSDVTMDGNAGTRFVIENSYEGDLQITLIIDALPIERCDLIKIDVEGSEVQVLEGAKETIMRFRPTLVIECFNSMMHLRGRSREHLVAWLAEADYDYRVGVGSLSDDRCDLVCTPRERACQGESDMVA